MATAVLSGTAVPSATEAEIRAEAETLIITLTGDTWIAQGLFDPDLFDPTLFDTTGFKTERQALIDNSSGDGTEWDLEKSNIPVTAVVRTSDTVVTITLSGLSGYDITAAEVVSWPIPGSILTSGIPIVTSNTFTINPVAAFAARYSFTACDRIFSLSAPERVFSFPGT